MKTIEIDERCSNDILTVLVGIADQCAKRQYWNAIQRTHGLMQLLFRSFDDILKRKN